jgi:hypothetical protein
LSSTTISGCPAYYCTSGSGTSTSQSISFSTSFASSECVLVSAMCPPCAPADKQGCPALGCGQAALMCSYDCAHGQGYNKSAVCNGHQWSVQTFLTSCSNSSVSPSCPDGGP